MWITAVRIQSLISILISIYSLEKHICIHKCISIDDKEKKILTDDCFFNNTNLNHYSSSYRHHWHFSSWLNHNFTFVFSYMFLKFIFCPENYKMILCIAQCVGCSLLSFILSLPFAWLTSPHEIPTLTSVLRLPKENLD